MSDKRDLQKDLIDYENVLKKIISVHDDYKFHITNLNTALGKLMNENSMLKIRITELEKVLEKAKSQILDEVPDLNKYDCEELTPPFDDWTDEIDEWVNDVLKHAANIAAGIVSDEFDALIGSDKVE